MVGILTDMLTGTLDRCERAMQKRLAACKDPTLRLQATRTGGDCVAPVMMREPVAGMSAALSSEFDE